MSHKCDTRRTDAQGQLIGSRNGKPALAKYNEDTGKYQTQDWKSWKAKRKIVGVWLHNVSRRTN